MARRRLFFAILLLSNVRQMISTACGGNSTALTTDADAFAALDYDYLIVGAGAGGLAVATKLAENEQFRIGIIEAGNLHESDPLIDIPANVGKASGNPLYDWSFETVPQPGAGGRSIILPRGKMVGGSTGINNMAWTRASRDEYDAWELFGMKNGWNWEGILPYMKQSETVFPDQTNLPIVNSKLYDPKFEGFTGPVLPSFNSWYSDIFPTYLAVANSSGIPPNFDSDQGTTSGFMNCRSSVKRTTGTRWYAAPAYYCSSASRPNFHVLINSQATQVLLERLLSGSYVATGVEFSSNNKTYVVKAKKEVILSAGTIQSPQLLELSGIGNSSILKSVGIDPLINLPEVGENMQDHLFVPAQYQLKPGILTFDALRINATVAATQSAIYAQNGTGMLSGTDTALSFLPLDIYLDPEAIDSLKHSFNSVLTHNSFSAFRRAQYEIQNNWLHQGLVPQSEIIMWSRGVVNLANESYATLLSGVLHPASRGSVHINSKDSLARPTIDAGWLTTDFDVHIILRTLKFAMKIAMSEPLASMIDSIVLPPPNVRVHNETELIEYIRENAASASHPMGTVAMAPRDLGGVVDDSLTVYGTVNLRVCDASILPNGIGTHLQSTIYAIGEKLADIIKNATDFR